MVSYCGENKIQPSLIAVLLLSWLPSEPQWPPLSCQDSSSSQHTTFPLPAKLFPLLFAWLGPYLPLSLDLHRAPQRTHPQSCHLRRSPLWPSPLNHRMWLTSLIAPSSIRSYLLMLIYLFALSSVNSSGKGLWLIHPVHPVAHRIGT